MKGSVLFLSGSDGDIEALASGCEVISVSGRRLLDVRSGRMYTMELNHEFLLEFLSSDRPEAQRLAALHCLLVYLQPNPVIELKVCERNTDNLTVVTIFIPSVILFSCLDNQLDQ